MDIATPTDRLPQLIFGNDKYV